MSAEFRSATSAGSVTAGSFTALFSHSRTNHSRTNLGVRTYFNLVLTSVLTHYAATDVCTRTHTHAHAHARVNCCKEHTTPLSQTVKGIAFLRKRRHQTPINCAIVSGKQLTTLDQQNQSNPDTEIQGRWLRVAKYKESNVVHNCTPHWLYP